LPPGLSVGFAVGMSGRPVTGSGVVVVSGSGVLVLVLVLVLVAAAAAAVMVTFADAIGSLGKWAALPVAFSTTELTVDAVAGMVSCAWSCRLADFASIAPRSHDEVPSLLPQPKLNFGDSLAGVVVRRMVESGTSPPVVQALTTQWTGSPRLLLDCERVTSTQRLTFAAVCCHWLVGWGVVAAPLGVVAVAVGVVAVGLGVGEGVRFREALGVAAAVVAGAVVAGAVVAAAVGGVEFVLLLVAADASGVEELGVGELDVGVSVGVGVGVGVAVVRFAINKVRLVLPPPPPRPKVVPGVTLVAAVGVGDVEDGSGDGLVFVGVGVGVGDGLGWGAGSLSGSHDVPLAGVPAPAIVAMT
jgi:hypothetical protein